MLLVGLAGGEGTQSAVVDSIRKIQFCLARLKKKVLQTINLDQNSRGLRRNLKTMVLLITFTLGIVIYEYYLTIGMYIIHYLLEK